MQTDIRSEIDKLNTSQVRALKALNLNYHVRAADIQVDRSGGTEHGIALVTLRYDQKDEHLVLGPRGAVRSREKRF